VQLTRSCRRLGIADWDYLTDPGRWIDTGHGDAGTLADEDPTMLARAVRACIDRIQPTTILTVDRAGLTGHPDHIAIHHAVHDAVVARGWQPQQVWGALLLRRHIVAAHALANATMPHRTVGSGRVRGREDDAVDLVIRCSLADAGRRRAALDAYASGLGTNAHHEQMQSHSRLGDSMLLRLAMDATDWHCDRFERIRQAGTGCQSSR
jgi:LmbE family N-acetylglucosaminyl deacetylase